MRAYAKLDKILCRCENKGFEFKHEVQRRMISVDNFLRIF